SRSGGDGAAQGNCSMKKPKTARHPGAETHVDRASAASLASVALKPSIGVPDSPTTETARHRNIETQYSDASETPATLSLKPSGAVPGSPTRKGRQSKRETHARTATSTPA